MAKNNISMVEETFVLALLARGDMQSEIATEFETKFSRPIAERTIIRIKQRNKENLEIMRTQTQAKIDRDQAAIRNKANVKIDKKLDNDDLAAQVIAKAHSQYINGEIEFPAYQRLLNTVRTLSVSELVTVSKEMHAQSSEAPGEAVDSEDMLKLQEAIQSGDTLTLSQLVFKRGQSNASSDTPLQHIPVGGSEPANN